MRVLQLIDSLRPGGAERMSVNYANALVKRIDASFLCCTRMEGLLKNQLFPEVGYLFLEKEKTLDLKAFLKLRKFVKENNINLIQAHSSSWFLAVLVKLSLPGVKLVWHDHYGKELQERKSGTLKPASCFFDGIISVNADLKRWAEDKLQCEEVVYFKNFLPSKKQEMQRHNKKLPLLGAGGAKIICLANLRPQKDHLNLLQAFTILKLSHPNITLHLVGKDEENSYSETIKQFIRDQRLEKEVFIYGEQENIPEYLKEADLGVLASASEGLPLALLEYGRYGLPVVCTRVGECKELIGTSGELVPPKDPEALAGAIAFYLNNEKVRKRNAAEFQKKINQNYSSEAVIPEVIRFFEELK